MVNRGPYEPGSRRGRAGRPYARLKRWVLDHFDDCCRCGLPVDKSLSGRHPWGPSLDHFIPLARGGDPLSQDNARLAHLHCNCAYRDGRPVTQRKPPAVRFAPSRSW